MELSKESYFNSIVSLLCSLADVLPKHDPQLVKIIKAISSTDTLKARAAINELTAIIESPEKRAVLRDYEEIFIQNVLAQLKVSSQGRKKGKWRNIGYNFVFICIAESLAVAYFTGDGCLSTLVVNFVYLLQCQHSGQNLEYDLHYESHDCDAASACRAEVDQRR